MPDIRSVTLAAAGLVLAAVGVMWSTHHDAPHARRQAPAAAAATGSAVAKPVLAPRKPGAPLKVRIPALHVSAPVIPIRARNRTLVPPSDPLQLGWWADGAKPGARRGSALITGHTVHTGGGALDDLEKVRRGDRVIVGTDHGRLTYSVQRTRVYSKGRIAQDAERLFSQKVPGRLVLITCEDWDGTRYLSNVVVTASLQR